MHLNGFGEAAGLARQPLDSRAQREMLPLYPLGIPFARLVFIRVDMTRISAPIVRIVARDPKWLQKRFQFQKHVVLPPSKNVG